MDMIQMLADFYMIDFFVDDHWSKLPNSWNMMQDLSCSEWADILDFKSPASSSRVLPLGVLALRQFVKSSAVNRVAVDNPEDIGKRLNIVVPHGIHFHSIAEDNSLRVKIKQKKRHEIERMLTVIGLLKDSEPLSDSIVDVGAGMGHLSRLIAHCFPDILIKTIDGDDKLVNSAHKMDNRLQRLSTNFSAPEREHRFVEPDEQPLIEGRRSLIIGLHPCGDLSATIIRTFVANPHVSSMILAGCCYHKLNSGSDKLFRQDWDGRKNTAETIGFPLSQKSACEKLSYASRELACHAIEQFAKTLRQQTDNEIILTHWHRAFLEWILVKFLPGSRPRHFAVRSVKKAHTFTFEEYVERSLLDDLELKDSVLQKLTCPDIADRLASRLIDAQRIFVIYCLRLLIAPFIESIIVRDRLAVIEEAGFRARILPLFRPELSPRSLIIVAQK